MAITDSGPRILTLHVTWFSSGRAEFVEVDDMQREVGEPVQQAVELRLVAH